MNYRARYYDSSVGRFLNEDPIEFKPGDLNAYVYVAGDPLNMVDPSGQEYDCPFSNPSCRAQISKHLSDCVKNLLQPYFPGVDLGQVQLIDQLPTEVKLGAAVDAGAFTWDNTIYYNSSYFGGNAVGIARIGHELTHVQQESQGLASFGWQYISNYVSNRISGESPQTAYQNISAERQANNLQRTIFQSLINAFGAGTVLCKEYCK